MKAYSRFILLVSAVSLVFPVTAGFAAQAPTLVLNPSSGNPPSVSGTLSGAGWCPPPVEVSVSGAGVYGEALINRDGTLVGSFTVNGTAGEMLEVVVTAFCPDTTLEAQAIFTFNSPPPTPTSTDPPPATATTLPAVTSTASPTLASTATSFSTPTAEIERVQPSGQNIITFLGCIPEPSKVQVEILPLWFIGEEGPSDGTSSPVFVPAVQLPDEPQKFSFSLPAADPGLLHKVTTIVDDPGCSVEVEPQYWLPQHELELHLGLPDATHLWAQGGGMAPIECSNIGGMPASDQSYGEHPPCLVTDYAVTNPPEIHKQTFQWFTDLDADSGILQISLWPFPTDLKSDLFSPPGLIATDPDSIKCVNCSFFVDFSDFVPSSQPSTQNAPWYMVVFNPIINFVKSVPQIVSDFAKDVGNFFVSFFGQPTESAMPPASAAPVEISASETEMGQQINSNTGKSAPPFIPSVYYFRVIPMKEDQLAGPASNGVRIEFTAPPPPPQLENVPNYQYQKLQVEILSYHGIIPPKTDKPCYIVTQTTTVKYSLLGGFNKTLQGGLIVYYDNGDVTFMAGAKICQPEPKEETSCGIGSLDEVAACGKAVVNALKDGWDWVSEAWSDVKTFVVEGFLEVTQLGSLCEKVNIASTCKTIVEAALNAGLAACGIPPDIPNFDQLMNEGLDYVVAEAAAQISIPPEVTQQLQDGFKAEGLAGEALDAAVKAAEAELRKQAEAAFKDAIEDQLEEIQYSYADKVDWLPKGVPVKPDPESDVQPPLLEVKITRDPNDLPNANTCPLQISSYATNDYTSPGFTIPDAAKQYLKPGEPEDLYVQKYLPGPILDPGESVKIPLILEPDYKSYWWATGYWSDYGAWATVYHGGIAHIIASIGSCGSADTLGSPADSTVTLFEN